MNLVCGRVSRFTLGGCPMDIIILFLLLATAGLMLLDAPRRYILTSWLVTAVLIAGLYKLHATSTLNLSF